MLRAPNNRFSIPHAPIKNAESEILTVGKGLAPSGGKCFIFVHLLGEFDKCYVFALDFLTIYWCLLPEGAEPLPYGSADSPCGFARLCTASNACSCPARGGCRALREGPGFSRLFGHAQKAGAFWGGLKNRGILTPRISGHCEPARTLVWQSPE